MTSSPASRPTGRSSPPATPARPRCRPCSAWSSPATRARRGSRSPASARPTTTRSSSTAAGSWRSSNEEPGLIQVSDDGGKTWDTREAPSAATPIDVAVDPGNSAQWAVSTDQGTFISANDGKTWRQRDTTFGARIAWAPDKLYSAGKDGTVRLSPDGGRRWLQVGSIGAGPKELVVSPKGEVYASVSGGEIRRSADGGATWSKVITLG